VSIVIVGKNGNVLSNEKSLDMSLSSDMMKQEWYVAAINSEMPVLTSARQQSFTMDKESWVISISQEISNDQEDNIGVLLIDIRYQVIEDYGLLKDLVGFREQMWVLAKFIQEKFPEARHSFTIKQEELDKI